MVARGGGWSGGGGSRSYSCEVESLSSRSPPFSGLWFLCLLSSWSQLRLCDEVVTAAYESQMKGKSASFPRTYSRINIFVTPAEKKKEKKKKTRREKKRKENNNKKNKRGNKLGRREEGGDEKAVTFSQHLCGLRSLQLRFAL